MNDLMRSILCAAVALACATGTVARRTPVPESPATFAKPVADAEAYGTTRDPYPLPGIDQTTVAVAAEPSTSQRPTVERVLEPALTPTQFAELDAAFPDCAWSGRASDGAAAIAHEREHGLLPWGLAGALTNLAGPSGAVNDHTGARRVGRSSPLRAAPPGRRAARAGPDRRVTHGETRCATGTSVA